MISLIRNTLVTLTPEWVVTLNRTQVVSFSEISTNGVFGLLFPSELDYETQYFTFVIPIPAGYFNGRPKYERVNQALKATDFYFPAEVAGEYREIGGEVSIDDDIFSYDSDTKIRFTRV